MQRFLIVVFFQSLRLPDERWQKENCKYPAKAHTAWNTLMKPYAWIYKAWIIIIYEDDRHITYRISWSWSVHKSKLPERQPPPERKRARETCLLYSFVFCVVCLQYKRWVLQGLFISGWNHVEIKWKFPHMTFVAQHGFKVRSMNIMLFWHEQNLILLLK